MWSDMMIETSFMKYTNEPGGIIGIHDDNRPRAFRNRARERVEVHLPLSVIRERIVYDVDEFEIRQEFEQWIGRPRDKHFIARIGEQFEDIRIRLAGARGRQDAVRFDRLASLSVIRCHRFARLRQSRR